MKNNSIATLAAALSVAAVLIAPGLSSAQTAAAPESKAGAEAAKPVKVAANTSHRAKNAAKVSAPAVEAPLTPAELAIAERVQVGQMPCELGASVTVSADPKTPGYFHMQGKNFRYRMAPVASSTGAVRLEDAKAGAVWLQLANKSMLMNQKLGTRLADECMSPAQVAFVQAPKTPPAANVQEAAKPVAAASAPGAAASAPVAAPVAAPASAASAPVAQSTPAATN